MSLVVDHKGTTVAGGAVFVGHTHDIGAIRRISEIQAHTIFLPTANRPQQCTAGQGAEASPLQIDGPRLTGLQKNLFSTRLRNT